ncbi:hypothetical protein THOE12_160009 [Vibrio rotiferianus]|nr:hypothetical protein THOE12_160009 [Vibrio rotiferianus]
MHFASSRSKVGNLPFCVGVPAALNYYNLSQGVCAADSNFTLQIQSRY